MFPNKCVNLRSKVCKETQDTYTLEQFISSAKVSVRNIP